MGKFIIQDLLIEKSEKDIQTGKKYSLSEGFNLICGENEAGKSSLMSFIKGGLFKTKGIDTGKIYFKINEKSYRADIKDAATTDPRCRLFDENNSRCDYKLITENIRQKYFEEGFTINLDDLMKSQRTDEFVTIIKDPSGDNLSVFINEIYNDISNNFSVDDKLKKNAKDLVANIADLNKKIKELSTKENDYNNSIVQIKTLNNAINDIQKKEENLKTYTEIKSINESLKELISERENALITFNQKLIEEQDKYIDIIHSIGKYSSNKEIISKCEQKLEIIKTKILENRTRLNIECGLTISEDIVKTLDIDYEKIRKIKDLVEDINRITTNKTIEEQKIEDLESNLLKINCELQSLNEFQNDKNAEELEEIASTIEEGLRQYHFINSEIDTVQKETVINSSAIGNNKKIQVLLGILFTVTILCAIVCFLQKIPTAGIFSILMSILALAGFSTLKLSSYEDRQNEEMTRKLKQKENILAELKEKVKPHFSEIENIEVSYLPIKLEALKQDFQTKISEIKAYNNSILKNSTERNYTQERLLGLKSKISNFNNEIEEIKNKINELSDKNIANEEVFGKKYIEAIEIIKSIKNALEEEEIILNEIKELKASNDEILSNTKNFIVENNINITISENITETVNELQCYYSQNNIKKQGIDALNSQIKMLEKELNSIEEINENEINYTQEELALEKDEKQKQKKELEFKKRELEKFEGISALKEEKNLQIEKYRTLIKNLFINKMVIELTNIAKSEFDKTQPDLINAQKYLAILTDNKYSKINLELQELENEDGTKIKKWEHLSRGTKEQLYLALRLGYASNYSKDKTTLEPNGKADLPLVVDDAFVNFDAKRTKNALKCLCEFSKTNQVLFFTCHTEMITKIMKELNGENLNIIQL